MDDGEDEGERGEEIGNHVLVRNIHNTGTCKPQSTDGWPRERERERDHESCIDEEHAQYGQLQTIDY